MGTEDGYSVRRYIKGYLYYTSGRLGRILIMRGYAERYVDYGKFSYFPSANKKISDGYNLTRK